MILYYIIFVILVLAFIARKAGNNIERTLYVIAILILILFCALRDGFLYPDIDNYYDYFRYGYTQLDLQEQFNFGYATLNHFCKLLSSSFQFLLLVVSLIILLLYSKAIKDYSPYIWLSLILFILINYYPSFFLLRQYLAIGVFLFSLRYVIKRKPIHYAICMIIALSFHTTAIVAIPVYLLYGIKNTKLNMSLVLIGSIVVIAVFFKFSTYIGLFSAYYAHYFEVEMEESAWKRALMKGFIFMVYLFIMRKHFYDKGINRLVFYCMVLNVVICIAAMNVMGVFRLREYFALADFVGIPIMIKQAKKMVSLNKLIALSMIVVYFVMLVLSFNSFIVGENMNNAYQFFWENKLLMQY